MTTDRLVMFQDLIANFIKRLEQAYVEKDEEQLTELFHPDQRNMSFLNRFQLQMLFQIYEISSEIIDLEVLDLFEDEVVFTYTRKHLYTCINSDDERDEKLNNLTSYYVEVSIEDGQLWITRYAPYSVVYLDKQGEILPGAEAVVPEWAQFFEKMQRFSKHFDLNNYQPATYKVYRDSEFIGYYPKDEFYKYENTEKFTIDYFEEMAAESIAEHNRIYLEQELVLGEIIAETEEYSIIETQYEDEGPINHELVLSMLAPDGFFMIRYQRNKQLIDPEVRASWIRQMQQAATEINNV